MRIAGTLSCSLCNGDGIRYVVFLQGCDHHCPGCQNPDTWDFDKGEEITIEDLVKDIQKHKFIDGITLSGGDPLYQEEECCKLLDMIPDMNVWVYTGFTWEEIKDRPLAKKANVLVTGPFIESLKCEGKPYGSSNQEINKGK